MDSAIELLLRLFAKRGQSAYFGEAVSQSEHALQTALAAERAGAPPTLIVAALLHDVGHLIYGNEADADHGHDDRHEQLGALWLSRHFGPDVAEPVRLHVPAKRYLCAIDTDYLANLSPASELSLRLQGGPYSKEEAAEFASNPYGEQAIALRRWDDAAKVPKMPTPDFDHYRPYLDMARTRHGSSNGSITSQLVAASGE
jgi:phosphonate degradation associated HDIG domain protein